MIQTKIIIMGAAGRDFHNFNVAFRNDPQYEVIAFTAAQIPGIDDKMYPASLSGEYYPNGIPIHPEEELTDLIIKHQVNRVIFAYSDVTHEAVMHKASVVLAAGADFWLMGPDSTMLKSSKPVISICATRTGCGKSQTTRKVMQILKAAGKQAVAIRHAMPYGNLAKQKVQRFAALADLKKHDCTIEEMEEYEPYIAMGGVVYAGVDYEAILREAEQEAEIILWDGGNNDLPFYVSDLEIVVTDPHRAGHETHYHPGETNLRRAQVVIINKMDTAEVAEVDKLRHTITQTNPKATVIEAASPITVEGSEQIKGKRVLVIEDGPTLTHGEMPYGAGVVAARQFGAKEIIDPRPWAVGSIKETFEKYPKVGALLPAMGYGPEQTCDLEKTINAVDCDLVIIGTPIDLNRVVNIQKPSVRVTYELQEIGSPNLATVLKPFTG
jgi:predicted GTPase